MSKAEIENPQPPILPFEIVDHTADWSIRVWGADLAQLFAHCAAGMAYLMVPDTTAVPTTITRQLTLEAYDTETLLVDFLTELAYWAEDEHLVFTQFDITRIDKTHLVTAVTGGRAPELVKHIKAVTYHNLAITKTAQGLEVTIVFDV